MNRMVVWLLVGLVSCLAWTTVGCKRPTSEGGGGSVATGGGGGGGSVADVSLATIGLTEDGWFQSYEQAVAKSKESGKPILVDFTGSDWCGWCIRLDNEVFVTDEFKQWADEHVVLLKLDYPRSKQLPPSLKQQNDELLQKHGVRGFPTILFLDSSGTKLGDYGYDAGGPEVWTKKADEILGT